MGGRTLSLFLSLSPLLSLYSSPQPSHPLRAQLSVIPATFDSVRTTDTVSKSCLSECDLCSHINNKCCCLVIHSETVRQEFGTTLMMLPELPAFQIRVPGFHPGPTPTSSFRLMCNRSWLQQWGPGRSCGRLRLSMDSWFQPASVLALLWAFGIGKPVDGSSLCVVLSPSLSLK